MKFLLFLLIFSMDKSVGLTVSDISESVFDTINGFIESLFVFERNEYRIEDISNIRGEYDFIIIGSGSAGSVLASRLSENPKWNVLLLEAGEPESTLGRIPLMAPLLQWTDYNWKYTTEPQENVCLAMEGHRCAFPRGKAIGGSSAINYMIYTRGSPRDYEKWEAMGNPGWGYQNVLPYFKKSERVHLNNYEADYHGRNGFLSTEFPFKSELTDAFLEAGKQLGLKLVDYNANNPIGVSYIQATLKNGRRHSVANAFLKRAGENLHILPNAFVTKINVNKENEATGVVFHYKGRYFKVKATKEVISSAGAFATPQLLMLSGVGPKNDLEELGIEVIKNLPVGRNLQDHLAYFGLAFTMNRTVEPASDLLDPNKLINWYVKGEGPLASLAALEALAFIKTNVSKEENYPDVELVFSGGGTFSTDYGSFNRRLLRITDEYYYTSYKGIEGKPTWTIVPILLHPKSRGFLKLKSRNPFEHPLIYPNYLSDFEQLDRKTLIESIRYIVKISKTEQFQKYNSKLNPIPVHGCETFEQDSDEYWSCALGRFASTVHHQLGTCKMGPETDTEAVVSADLKVHGLKKLRVADTSVIPLSLSAHTNAPSVMIGEKAADLIKLEWGESINYVQ